jgi:hypothetical protein
VSRGIGVIRLIGVDFGVRARVCGRLFGWFGAVEFSELFFVVARLGGDGFQGEAELIDLDL